MLIKTYMLDLKQIWDVWEIWDIFKFMYLTLIFPEFDCIVQNASFLLGATLDENKFEGRASKNFNGFLLC